MELLFGVSTLLVLPFWLLMIALPSWNVTRLVLRSPLVLSPLLLFYTVLLATHWRILELFASHPTLPILGQILATPEGALLAWVHFLALDLFVGRWIYLDSQERGFPALAMVPLYWATLLVGPVGLLLYVAVRPLSRRPETSEDPITGNP